MAVAPMAVGPIAGPVQARSGPVQAQQARPTKMSRRFLFRIGLRCEIVGLVPYVKIRE